MNCSCCDCARKIVPPPSVRKAVGMQRLQEIWMQLCSIGKSLS
ncbi:hypothetical protein CEV33_1373 [Brucella grignonensis]|uniref:Uncharacterized protein n=1 Tax=Brucella grignonensis TaxID=94627 RepID=A0A256FBJ1_9HYPH|nr:hypothetical protein CEV33_1373 [Brucella grignonensis]